MLGGDPVREPEPTPSQIRGPVPGHGEPASHGPRDGLGAKDPLGSGCPPSVTGSREGSLERLGFPRCRAPTVCVVAGSRAKSRTRNSSRQVYLVIPQPVRYKTESSLWGEQEGWPGKWGAQCPRASPRAPGSPHGRQHSLCPKEERGCPFRSLLPQNWLPMRPGRRKVPGGGGVLGLQGLGGEQKPGLHRLAGWLPVGERCPLGCSSVLDALCSTQWESLWAGRVGAAPSALALPIAGQVEREPAALLHTRPSRRG